MEKHFICPVDVLIHVVVAAAVVVVALRQLNPLSPVVFPFGPRCVCATMSTAILCYMQNVSHVCTYICRLLPRLQRYIIYLYNPIPFIRVRVCVC